MATLKWVTQKCSLIFFIVFFLVILTSISPNAENSPVPQKQIKTIPLKISEIRARPVNERYWIAMEKDSLANWTANSVLRRIGLLLEISKSKQCAVQVQVSFLLPSGYEDWDVVGTTSITLPEGKKITFIKSKEKVIIPLQIPGDEKIVRGLIEKQDQNTFIFQSP